MNADAPPDEMRVGREHALVEPQNHVVALRGRDRNRDGMARDLVGVAADHLDHLASTDRQQLLSVVEVTSVATRIACVGAVIAIEKRRPVSSGESRGF
jgi:hypothetical protein